MASPASDTLDHLLADDVILVSSRSSPLSPYPTRPLAPRASAGWMHSSPDTTAPPVATALIARPAGISRTDVVTDADSAYLDAAAVSYTDNSMTASVTLADLANLTEAVAATALNSDDGEEDDEDNGGLYHVPARTEAGPFYVVTRGLEVGIFAGWWVFFNVRFTKPFTIMFQGQYLSACHWRLQRSFFTHAERS